MSPIAATMPGTPSGITSSTRYSNAGALPTNLSTVQSKIEKIGGGGLLSLAASGLDFALGSRASAKPAVAARSSARAAQSFYHRRSKSRRASRLSYRENQTPLIDRNATQASSAVKPSKASCSTTREAHAEQSPTPSDANLSAALSETSTASIDGKSPSGDNCPIAFSDSIHSSNAPRHSSTLVNEQSHSSPTVPATGSAGRPRAIFLAFGQFIPPGSRQTCGTSTVQ